MMGREEMVGSREHCTAEMYLVDLVAQYRRSLLVSLVMSSLVLVVCGVHVVCNSHCLVARRNLAMLRAC